MRFDRLLEAPGASASHVATVMSAPVDAGAFRSTCAEARGRMEYLSRTAGGVYSAISLRQTLLPAEQNGQRNARWPAKQDTILTCLASQPESGLKLALHRRALRARRGALRQTESCCGATLLRGRGRAVRGTQRVEQEGGMLQSSGPCLPAVSHAPGGPAFRGPPFVCLCRRGLDTDKSWLNFCPPDVI